MLLPSNPQTCRQNCAAAVSLKAATAGGGPAGVFYSNGNSNKVSLLRPSDGTVTWSQDFGPVTDNNLRPPGEDNKAQACMAHGQGGGRMTPLARICVMCVMGAGPGRMHAYTTWVKAA